LGNGATSCLQESWSLIENTDPDEVFFCSLMGALGVSPYDTDASIDKALDIASGILSKTELMDVCLSSTPENIVRSAFVAGKMESSLADAAQIDLARLEGVVPPADKAGGPAWRVGYLAAQRLREHLSISDRDITGAAAVFDKLKIDPVSKPVMALRGVDTPLLGGIQKADACGKMVLVQESPQGRRFAAARGAYFLWASECDDRRLITNAVTRDQQVSRAFAAEMLVPASYIRTQAKGSRLSWGKLHDIAFEAGVASELIKHQASNHGLTLVA
jgi:hypothetical protein